MFNLIGDSEIAIKKANKRKLHELLNKYGSVREIERSGNLQDAYAFDFAKINGTLDEVLEERRMGYREPLSSNGDTLKSKVKQSNALLPDDEDFSLEGLTLSDRQRKAIGKLDMNTQLSVIRALREQQSVEKPKAKKETSSSKLDVLQNRVEKANRELKVADNEHERTKSDVRVEKDEELNIDNNKFNQDIFINKTMRPIIEDNEGITSYPYLDTNGFITIGVGANINNNPLNMDWYYKNPDTGKLRHLDKNNPDDLKLIKEEIHKLRQEPKGKDASHYEEITNLRISDEYLNKLYYNRTKDAIEDIRYLIKEHNENSSKKIASFEKMPKPLQIVLIDMVFNLGRDGFSWKPKVIINKDGNKVKKGYPSFWKALENRDLSNMIKESKRYSEGKELASRNKKTRETLELLYEYGYNRK